MNQIIARIASLAFVVLTFATLQGCGGGLVTTMSSRSTTPAGTQTTSSTNVLGVVHNESVVNDSEVAYQRCMTAHEDDARPSGFNAAEDYCFRRTTLGGALYGSPYYGQYYGAFTGAWGAIPAPVAGGGTWVRGMNGLPYYLPGGVSVTQGTALDPLMAPAVVAMDAQRTAATDATVIEQGQAVTTYPVQGGLSAPSARAVSGLSPDALAELQRRVTTVQQTVLTLSREVHARH